VPKGNGVIRLNIEVRMPMDEKSQPCDLLKPPWAFHARMELSD
jgi:hypothetical protein